MTTLIRSMPVLRGLVVCAAAGVCVGTAPGASGQGGLESELLVDHVRLTSPSDFHRAGEAYFSPDGQRIIFQATPVAREGEEQETHYQMYVAELVRDSSGRVTGIGEAVRLSVLGSSNTCGWFHPTEPKVLFGTTFGPPDERRVPGYQRDGGRYQWAFPSEMTIVTMPDPLAGDGVTGDAPEPQAARAMFERDGYTAEASWSPCGRFVLYAQIDEERRTGRPEADLWIYDTKRDEHVLVVGERGYDGGPFFSACGRFICYRSDREGDSRLQLFVAVLAFDEEGGITGISAERRITDNTHVNWAPYFHPSGRFLVYAGSNVGHQNYEVFAIGLDPDDGFAMREEERPIGRVTFSMGFDGLPVFSPDGRYFMWTSQREWEGERGTSQVWLARVASDDPEAWTGPVTERQASVLVRAEVEAITTGAGEGAALLAERDGDGWRVEAAWFDGERRRTEVFGVDRLGQIERVEREEAVEEAAF